MLIEVNERDALVRKLHKTEKLLKKSSKSCHRLIEWKVATRQKASVLLDKLYLSGLNEEQIAILEQLQDVIGV